MKDFIQERKAIINGVALNNEMIKKAERNNINFDYCLSNAFAMEYNSYIEAFPENVEKDFPEIYERIRNEAIARIKYHLYYGEYEYY